MSKRRHLVLDQIAAGHGPAIDRAIEAVQQEFPFPGYLDADYVGATRYIADKIVHLAEPGARVLDIGSGPMDVTAVLAKLGYECFAADDLSDPWHQLGDNRQRIEAFAKQSGITFHHQDGDYGIPFEEASFDVVLLKSVIEHLHESPRELLNTAFRFAKTHGAVVVTMPNSVSLRKRLSVVRGKTNYPPVDGMFHSAGQWRGHVREYTLDETAYLLEQVGGNIRLEGYFDSVSPQRISSAAGRKVYDWLTEVLDPALRTACFVAALKPVGWQPATFDEDDYWAAIAKSVPAGVLPRS